MAQEHSQPASDAPAHHARATDRHTPESAGWHDGHGHGVQGHRTHKFNPANVERLLGEERRRLLPPEETLRAAGVASGETVVDLGCGPGYFTLPAATLVGPRGRVYAVDVQRELLDVCQRRVAEAGLANIEAVLSDESRVPLSDGSADRVFAAFVLHETDQPAAFLREASRIAKPDGEVVLVEWKKQDGPPGPPREHRLARDEVLAHAEGAGLTIAGERELNDHHYLVRLRRQGTS